MIFHPTSQPEAQILVALMEGDRELRWQWREILEERHRRDIAALLPDVLHCRACRDPLPLLFGGWYCTSASCALRRYRQRIGQTCVDCGTLIGPGYVRCNPCNGYFQTGKPKPKHEARRLAVAQ